MEVEKQKCALYVFHPISFEQAPYFIIEVNADSMIIDLKVAKKDLPSDY